MVDFGVPAGAQPIVETGPGVYTFEWNPSNANLVCDVGIGMTRLARLDSNNRTFTTFADTPPPNAWTLVQLPDGSITYSPNFNPDPTTSPDKTTDTFDYGYTINGSNNEVRVTFVHGARLLTGMRFNFHFGTGKPGNMAIEVLIAPASNKDNPFAGYAQPRPPSDIATAPSNPPDAMHQSMTPYPKDQLTTVDMMMLRPVTPDDLNAIVRIWVDPQSGGYFDRADAISFRWGVVPQWNGAWGGEISAGDWLTMGREADQPSYYEHPAYIDPSNS
jgi:hypothetical protein